MIEDMAQVHMTEAELARDLHAALEQVRQGAEIIVERDATPVAVIKAPQFREHSLDECNALAKAQGLHATLDEDFGKDLEDILSSHRESLDASWD
jgi:antitoxin (DNA-binding transcriptional repressor) of toxin-antitoxin stability system